MATREQAKKDLRERNNQVLALLVPHIGPMAVEAIGHSIDAAVDCGYIAGVEDVLDRGMFHVITDLRAEHG